MSGAPRSALAAILDGVLADLGTLPPISRALRLRELSDDLRLLAEQVGDAATEAVFAATREAPAAAVAVELGVSASAVANRVVAYRKLNRSW